MFLSDQLHLIVSCQILVTLDFILSDISYTGFYLVRYQLHWILSCVLEMLTVVLFDLTSCFLFLEIAEANITV